VKFEVFSKIKVNGENTHPLWKFLKMKKGGLLGKFIKWNFTKFIVDKRGNVVERFGSDVNPNNLIKFIDMYICDKVEEN
jgi:glutathione peroxidase-family protein